MSTPCYRTPGYPCARSLWYINQLELMGWPQDWISLFAAEIPRFESASLLSDFEEALEAFSISSDEEHHLFLRGLNKHIKELARAERNEELQRKAVTSDKDSIAAHAILSGKATEDGKPVGGAVVDINVRLPKKEVITTRGKPQSK